MLADSLGSGIEMFEASSGFGLKVLRFKRVEGLGFRFGVYREMYRVCVRSFGGLGGVLFFAFEEILPEGRGKGVGAKGGGRG